MISFIFVFCLIVASMLQVQIAARKSMDALAKFSTEYEQKAGTDCAEHLSHSRKAASTVDSSSKCDEEGVIKGAQSSSGMVYIGRRTSCAGLEHICRPNIAHTYILPSAISIYELVLYCLSYDIC
jgi:hypothetical protein